MVQRRNEQAPALRDSTVTFVPPLLSIQGVCRAARAMGMGTHSPRPGLVTWPSLTHRLDKRSSPECPKESHPECWGTALSPVLAAAIFTQLWTLKP
jgi:hypothetical protein